MFMDRQPIKYLTIKGFKSIKNLERFPLRNLNVLIGANGSGKSNFVSFFSMMKELANGRLKQWTSKQGTADRIVSFGVNTTRSLASDVEFAGGSYSFTLDVTADGLFSFKDEKIISGEELLRKEILLGDGHRESLLKKSLDKKKEMTITRPIYSAIDGWSVFHFHDTSDTALVKRIGSLRDNDFLRSDGSNLAAFLYKLGNEEPNTYRRIRDTVNLALPFFEDFVLKPEKLQTEECQVNLTWKRVGSDYVLWPSQLSDGSIRFMCLATALLQPNPPASIVIDEPELGLHPNAITLLAALLKSASAKTQIIVSTQSVELVNEFSIDDLVIVEQHEDGTVFRREAQCDFETWLQEYSVGELWEKSILDERPA
jgi:predicted ATPase